MAEPSESKQAELTCWAAEWRQPLNLYRCHIAIWCSMCCLSLDFTDFRWPMFTSVIL